MSTTLKLSILVFIILLPLAYYGTQRYVKVPPPVVPPVATFVQVDEHLSIDETLKEVNFCGTTYKVKQVKIDGVDVVQRVAELATKDMLPDVLKNGPYANNEWKKITSSKEDVVGWICDDQKKNGVLDVETLSRYSAADQGFKEGEFYGITIGGKMFDVLYPDLSIYLKSEFDGSLVGPIGKLK